MKWDLKQFLKVFGTLTVILTYMFVALFMFLNGDHFSNLFNIIVYLIMFTPIFYAIGLIPKEKSNE